MSFEHLLHSEQAEPSILCSPPESKPFVAAGASFARGFAMYGKPGDILERQWGLGDNESIPGPDTGDLDM